MSLLLLLQTKNPAKYSLRLNDVTAAFQKGSLITVVWGTKALAKVVASDKSYKQEIFPLLIAQLKKCISRDLPMHAESILPAIDGKNKQEFLSILEMRKPEMTASSSAKRSHKEPVTSLCFIESFLEKRLVDYSESRFCLAAVLITASRTR